MGAIARHRMAHGQELLAPWLFADRVDAGRQLARALEAGRPAKPVVVGLARGGVVVAAEVARRLHAPLDAVAVRKVRHPWQPEYALGAATPEGGVYVRAHDRLDERELAAAVAAAREEARLLDRTLHSRHDPVPLATRTVLVVDDGLATGATMIAAVRWARGRGATRIVAAIPVASAFSMPLLDGEADAVVCPHVLEHFFAVGDWYASFEQLDDADVLALLAENRRAHRVAASSDAVVVR